MTTDITELAQSLKSAATEATLEKWYVDNDFDVCSENYGFVAELHGDNLVHNAQFIAMANPLNVEKVTAALKSFHAAFEGWQDKTEWVQKDRRFDVLKPWGMHRADVLKAYIEHLEARIVELESRTVKLPDLRQIVSWDRYVWSDGVYNYSQDVKVALAAAGIKVEAE